MAIQFKIFSLAMKQLAKPLVASFRSFATTNKTFKKGCINIGQLMHRLSSTTDQIGKGRLNLPGSPQILPLSEERALENGASMLSELVLFSIAGGLVYWENARSAKSSENKQTKQEERLGELEGKVNDLVGIVLEQQSILKANTIDPIQ